MLRGMSFANRGGPTVSLCALISNGVAAAKAAGVIGGSEETSGTAAW